MTRLSSPAFSRDDVWVLRAAALEILAGYERGAVGWDPNERATELRNIADRIAQLLPPDEVTL